MTDQTALVLLFKRPLEGQGKQRLAVDIGSSAAFEVAKELFQLSAELLEDWPRTSIASVSNVEDQLWARSQFSKEIVFYPQSEGNLGERIQSLDCQLREDGFERILYIGSDAPMLDVSVLERVDEALGDNDVVMLPSSDGGVSLMASSKPWPALNELSWSTPVLGQQLKDICEAQGYSVVFLEEYNDIDILEDLQVFIADFDPSVVSQSKRDFFKTVVSIVGSIDGVDP